MDPRRAILDAVRLVDRALRLSSASVERDLGISVAQLYVLRTLRERDGQSVGELARATLTHQSSVSVVVSRLVARGLVRRAVAEGDRRRVELSLTPRGRALVARAPEAVQVRLVRALDALAASERRTLADLLTRWARAASLDGAPPSLFGEDGGRTR